MKVTLYKGCKLNNKYKDVFFNKTFLEGYLSLLDNVIPLQDDEIFSRNTDVLYFEDTTIIDFKQYNYMKIEDSIGTFYAFIKSIQWVNEVYVVNYEEDIMSNWFEYAHIRNSLLTGNRSLYLYKGNNKKQIRLFTYPVLPQSNDYIDITGYNIVDNPIYNGQEITDYKPKISLVVKMQLYGTEQLGNPNTRIPIIGVIAIKNTNGNNITYNYDLYSNSVASELHFFLEAFIAKQATQQIIYYGANLYYDIDKIYAVPTDYLVKDNILYASHIKHDLFDIGGVEFIFNEIYGTTPNGVIGEYEKTIPYNRDNKSVGLFSLPIDIVNNGTDVKVKIKTCLKYYGISFILNVQNKIYDITEQFLLDLPFTQVSASELQLKRLQLTLEKNDLLLKQGYDRINNITGLVNLFTKMDSGKLNYISSVLSSVSTSNPSNAIGGVAGMIENTGDIINIAAKNVANTLDFSYLKEKFNLINSELYSTTSVANNEFSYINALYGLCLFKIIEDNSTQVVQGVNLSGYNVLELVNDVIQELDIDNLTDKYEVFKFDEVNVYGVMSQEYINFIEEVLLSGVRIWCQNNIGDII